MARVFYFFCRDFPGVRKTSRHRCHGLFGICVGPSHAIDVSAGMDVTRLYYGTDTRIYALLLGAAMGLYHDHFNFNFLRQPWGKAVKYGVFSCCWASPLPDIS